MAYDKHNFESGAKLYASQLNEMDAQIALNEEAAKNAADKKVSWDEVTDKPFGMEVTDTMSLFAQGVSFTNKQYAITAPFAGPLILGGIYSIRVKPYNSSDATNYTGLTAVQRKYNEKDYIIVGDLNCVPGLSDTQDPASVAFVIDPDNKPDENGVYGWIFTDQTFSGPPTVWLYGSCEIIHPLPKKYLPDDIPTSGGGSVNASVIALNDSMLDSSATGSSLAFIYPESYDAIAEILHNGGNVWLDVSSIEEAGGGGIVCILVVAWVLQEGLLLLSAVAPDGFITVNCTNGTWTPPTTA